MFKRKVYTLLRFNGQQRDPKWRIQHAFINGLTQEDIDRIQNVQEGIQELFLYSNGSIGVLGPNGEEMILAFDETSGWIIKKVCVEDTCSLNSIM